MNEKFASQAQEMFTAARDAKIPENVQAMVEDGVAKSRDAFDKMSNVASDNAKAVEEMVVSTQEGVKTLGEKVLENTAVNTEAVFDAAEQMARATTLPEVARLQASFVQQQFAIAGAQSKELFELSTKVAQQAFESANAATTKTFEKLKDQA